MISNPPPIISVIVPHKPGQERVRVLESLSRVDYPPDRYEIIVAEGFHPSKQRNMALAEARGEIVMFFDDDVMPEPQIFKRVAEDFEKYREAAVVGGPSVTQPTDSFMQQCFARVMRSRLAMGKSIARYESNGTLRETNESELILCNVAMRRSVFEKLGGFDERLWPNEENELFDRLQANGWKLLYDPQVIVYRSHRPTLSAFVKMMSSYGRGRMGQTLIRPTITCGIRMIPAAFVLYLASLVVWHPWWYVLPLTLYAALMLAASVYHVIHNRVLAGLMSAWLLPLTHVAYGIGLLSGLVFRLGRHVEPPGATFRLRIVKRAEA